MLLLKEKKYQEEVVKKYTIIKDLPIKSRSYIINDCGITKTNDVEKLTLCVKTNNPDVSQLVSQHLINMGYKPSDYVIKFSFIEN